MIKDFNNPFLAGHISSAGIETVKYMLQKYGKLNFEIFRAKFKKVLKDKLTNDEKVKDLANTVNYDEIAKFVYRKIAEYYITHKSFKGLSEYLQLVNFILEGDLTFRTLREQDIEKKLF
jgi:hypothetical protein